MKNTWMLCNLHVEMKLRKFSVTFNSDENGMILNLKFLDELLRFRNFLVKGKSSEIAEYFSTKNGLEKNGDPGTAVI